MSLPPFPKVPLAKCSLFLVSVSLICPHNLNQQISQNLSITPKMEKAQIVQYLSLLTDEKVRVASKAHEMN